MGTGIGINCRRCGHQLNYDQGFDSRTSLCNECYSIVKFENGEYPTSLDDFDINDLISNLFNRSEYDIDIDHVIKLSTLYSKWTNIISNYNNS
jgi:hypothetical protein